MQYSHCTCPCHHKAPSETNPRHAPNPDSAPADIPGQRLAMTNVIIVVGNQHRLIAPHHRCRAMRELSTCRRTIHRLM